MLPILFILFEQAGVLEDLAALNNFQLKAEGCLLVTGHFHGANYCCLSPWSSLLVSVKSDLGC